MAYRRILGFKTYTKMDGGIEPPVPGQAVYFVRNSSGSALDTGIACTANIEVGFTLYIAPRTSGTYNNWEFGCRTTSTSEDRFGLYYSTSVGSSGFLSREFSYRFGTYGALTNATNKGGENTYKFNKSGAYLNDVLIANSSTATFTPNPNLSIYLMAMNTNGTIQSEQDTIYGWRSAYIKDGEKLLREFEAWKDPDGKYCFYDRVSKQFFYPISGNFTGQDNP